MSLSIRFATIDELKLTREIAYESWPGAYEHILSDAQLNHMLSLFYNDDALASQFFDQQHQFIIAFNDHHQHIGFASFSRLEESTKISYKLHKLYILPQQQQSGTGKAMIEFITEHIQQKGATHLLLNVNRQNAAIFFYKKMGFEIIREEDIDIGNGYYMNDYVMEKKLG